MRTLTLNGGWIGETNDPQRHFLGTVLTSDMPEVRVGAATEVRFESGQTRIKSPGEHGVYALFCGTHRLTLTGFTRQNASMGSRSAQDDSQEAVWTATVI